MKSKNYAVFCLFLATLLVVLSGCATTNRSKAKVPKTPQVATKAPKVSKAKAPRGPKGPSPEKIARVNEQWERNQVVTKMSLGLSCPVGGAEKVEVHNRLGSEAKYLGIGNATKLLFARQVFVLRVRNGESGSVDIEDTQGVVVRNMCPKGSITLTKSLMPFTSGYVDAFWTANGINSKGDVGQDVSPRGVLYNNSWRAREDANWVIQLKVQTGGFFERK